MFLTYLRCVGPEGAVNASERFYIDYDYFIFYLI